MSSFKFIEKVLDRLRANLGLGENPPGSNHNFITVWYNKEVASIGNGPWCEMTASWAMATGGAALLKKPRAYTVWGAMDAKDGFDGASWHYGTRGMRAGDQVYYDWSGRKGQINLVDHTGIVEKIMGDGTFYVLEGNTSANKLLRMRRDGRYVVGYIRFAWAKLEHSSTPVEPTVKKKPPLEHPNRGLVQRLQVLFKIKADGQWGSQTDSRARAMRAVSRAKLGYPKNAKIDFPVREVQSIVGTPVDGKWGVKSQAALTIWVRRIQRQLGVEIDGRWGPKTDNAFFMTRHKHLNNF